MKDIAETRDEFLEKKKEEIKEILMLFEHNKEELLQDQYNNGELFNKIKKLASSKGGFLDNNSRRELWKNLFYKKNNKKGAIDVIKINEDIKVNMSKLNLFSQKKELTDSKIKEIKDFRVITNDLPRTCEIIITNKIKKTEKKINNTSPKIIMFSCKKFQYQYLQGLLNIIFYFQQIFNYEDCIIALNIFFELFYKDLIDQKLCKEKKDENIGLISKVVTDLYKYLYKKNEESEIITYIPILCNKWIISSFISDLTDINKGFRIFDYLIVSEPYVRYVLAAILINKFNDTINTKRELNEKLDSLGSSYENIFDELKTDDINSFDLDEIINEAQNLIEKKGKEIKNYLIEKYGKNFIFSFNEKNQGLITLYKNLLEIMNIKKLRKESRINLVNPKYCLNFLIIFSISFILYKFYDLIDNSRILW